MADRKDDQNPGQAGPAGGDPAGPGRGACRECGTPLAPDQRYCVSCGARRGLLPSAVAALSSKGKAAASAAGAATTAIAAGKAGKGKAGGGSGDGGSGGKGDGGTDGTGDGGWSWMPSPPAIAIAVIGMLALGVGLGSAMSEVASSAPLQTILLEYPHHAVEGSPPAEEPEAEEEFGGEEEAPVVASAPEETAPIEPLPTAPLPVEPLPEGTEGATEESNPLQEAIEKTEEEQREREEEEASGEEGLPEVKHAFLIVLGEGGYEETWGAASAAPYLSRTLPKKGELLPNYYGVTSGVLANEIALLSGQGPTAATAANCPEYTAVAPGTVSTTAAQVEGDGCVYGKEVASLPSELSAANLSWRAYVQDMENGGPVGQSFRCRRPALGGPDWSPTPAPGDQYVTWRNPVVYFSAIVEGGECEKHDVGFELLSKDLSAKKKTPALSLIFPNACHSGGEYECEPGAPKGAQGVAEELKTLVPAIMASPAYEEGGLIAITAAQAPQTGERADPSGCCVQPAYPNLPAPPAGTTGSPAGGKVGLLMISPFVEPGKVEEAEEANHFTLLKTLAKMLGVEPIGYAAEEEVSTLSAELFVEPPAESTTGSPRSPAGSQARAAPRPGTF